jgi:hypothetical protein
MKHLTVPLLLLAAGMAAAQDMPLHEIIKPGETWQASAGEMPARIPGGYHSDLR